jgi:hypothetical protein
MELWRGTAGTARLLKRRNEIIREKMWVTHTILERLEDMSKWYGHVLCTKGNRWAKRIMTWRVGGRQEVK